MKKLLSLGSDGNLVLKLPDGKQENISQGIPGLAYLLIDSSGSMSGDKLNQAKKGGIRFTENALSQNYSIGIIKFDSNAVDICKPQKDFKNIKDAVRSIETEGSTDLTAALEIAFSAFAKANGNRVIVVLTDGVPDDADTALAVGEKAKACGIDIICIGTDDADQDFLSRLASQKGFGLKVPSSQFEKSISSAALFLPAPQYDIVKL